jgi:coronin-1B/1C/6
MVSSKSQNIHFIDARTSEVSALVSKAHDGGKSIKLASLCDGSERLLSAGTGKGSLRQCKIWDPRNLSTEVCKVDVDNASGTLMPFYDRDTGLLYLGGKGDANIRYYEIPYNGSDIHLISDFKSNIATKGLAMVPKRSLDVMSCEINRFLKLTSNSIEPISFYVPRKSTSFQDDLYPDVYGDVAAHTIEEWLSGSDAMPHKISLRPPDAGKPGSGRSPRAEEFEFVKSRPSSDLPALDDSNVRREEELLSEIRRAKMRIFGLENRLRKSGLSAI